MKKQILIACSVIIATMSACGQEKHNQPVNKETITIKNETAPVVITNNEGPLNPMITNYFTLKNALTSDDGNAAAEAGREMYKNFEKLEKTSFTDEQKKAFLDIEDDAKEHAEHIGQNGSNIEHQREHFALLSKDMYDLVKVFGTDKIIYKDFCPMYNKKKGAIWLSENKPISNPYYGKAMLTCGSVKEEIK